MAKKRTTTAAGIAEAQGGRKKRQAARESEAKISRMVEDERDADDDEFDEVVSTRPDKLQAVATPKLVRPEDMPLYAPGLRLFEGFSDTIRNTEIAALTKMEPDIEQSRKYGFTMKPLIATDGPLAGQTILVLEPTATFRFMDLPPEIRNMVYGYLIDAPRENMIISYKPVHKERRSISSTFRLGTYGSVNRRRGRSGLSWDPQNGKWVAQLPLPYGLLRVSRQIQSETGSLLYGNTTFSFGEWSDMSLFLDTIGNMRRFLCRVKLPFAYKGYTKSSAIIKKLQGATSLETLLVQHEDLCSSSVKRRGHIGVHAFVAGFKHVLKAVQSSQASAGAASSGSVLDILRIEAKTGEKSMCTHCSENSQRYCPDCAGNRDHDLKCYGHINCRVPCSEHEAHCQELADEVRAELAKALGIEE